MTRWIGNDYCTEIALVSLIYRGIHNFNTEPISTCGYFFAENIPIRAYCNNSHRNSVRNILSQVLRHPHRIFHSSLAIFSLFRVGLVRTLPTRARRTTDGVEPPHSLSRLVNSRPVRWWRGERGAEIRNGKRETSGGERSQHRGEVG